MNNSNLILAARATLEEARRRLALLADESDAVAEQTAKQPQKRAQLAFVCHATKDLMRVFEESKKGIETAMSRHTGDRETVLAEARTTISEFKKVKGQMIEIKVDFELNQHGKSLYDYINDDQIGLIITQLEASIKSIEKCLSATFIDSIEMRLDNEWKYISQQWDALYTNYQTQTNERHNQIELLLENNTNLELETVELLHGLNDHYDKCQLYSKSPSPELLKVLCDDNESLPTVMQVLIKNCTIISQNFRDIKRYLSKFDSIKAQFISFLKEIESFNSEVISNQIEKDLLVELDTFDQTNDQILHYKEELLGYQTDCTLFMTSYYNLLVELERRRSYNDQLKRLSDEFQMKINSLYEEDSNQRNLFLEENADFIPQDLINPQIVNSDSPKVIIDYKLERIPRVSSNAIRDIISSLS